MIATSDGYSLFYDVPRNRVVIGLPQTFRTVQNSLSKIVERRVDVEESELAFFLPVVRGIFEKSIEQV